jgi:pectin methylesterase-like acyl-CoA thioesterase
MSPGELSSIQEWPCTTAPELSFQGKVSQSIERWLTSRSDDLTATVRQWNPNTKFYNLNIANTFGHVPKNGQNLALSAHTTNQGYYACQLLGYQDTLLANVGNQLYVKNLIVGAVDFIFGQTATAWLEQCDIRTIATGSITASGRAAATSKFPHPPTH